MAAARGTRDSSENNIAPGTLSQDVQSLVQSVKALSERITSSPVNSEVSQVFAGRRRIAPIAANSNASTSLSSSSNSSSAHGPSSENHFSHYRRLMNSRRIGMKCTGKRSSYANQKPFFCDVVLLSGPKEACVPRQSTKVMLSERGHIISACQFNKNMNETEVESTIREALDGVIPPLVDLEILQSVHSSLVKPVLAPSQPGIDGMIVHRLFKCKNKPMYVRPSEVLIPELVKENEEDERNENKQVSQEDTVSSGSNQSITDLQNPGSDDLPTNHSDYPVLQNVASANLYANLPDPETQNAEDAISSVDVPTVEWQSFESYNSEVHVADTEVLGAALLPEVEEVIRINRNNVLKDMIFTFRKCNILNCCLQFVFINERGEEEEGRGSGITREALSIFWREFYQSLTVGASEKVPSIRHDYQREAWESVARILVFGYMKERYFPIALSRAFVASCLFDEEVITAEWLLDAFYHYLPTDEGETLKRCLGVDSENPADDNELADVLSSYKCFRRVTKHNLLKVLQELAHQELVQKPKYVSDAWVSIVRLLKQYDDFKTLDSLTGFYHSKRPTAKKVCKLLTATPSTEAEKDSFSHLKRFVKSLDSSLVSVFLQFATGSNIITVDKLEVGFSTLEPPFRQPVAHTCGPLLIIPSTYDSYNELSEEFINIFHLKAAWSFSII